MENQVTTFAKAIQIPELAGAVNTSIGLSVIIPAYNEEKGIGVVLEQLSSVLEGSSLPHEILVVDDGSQDNTSEVAKGHEGVKVLRHKGNRGYGASLKTGIRHAHYGLVAITDADGTYPIGRIPDLVEKLVANDFDMIVGARTGTNVAIPLIRRPAKWAIGKLANMVAGEQIPDINSGLRVFKRVAALRFFNLFPDGFSFTTTITLAMLSNGYLVDFVAIDYHERVGSSKIRPIRATLNFIQLIFRISLYFAPLKVFLPLSAFLILLGVAWSAFSALLLGALADVSTLVLLATGIQVAVIGLLAELINRRLPNYYRSEDLE